MSSEAIDSKSQRKGTEVIRKRNEELEERYNRVFILYQYFLPRKRIKIQSQVVPVRK